MKWDEEQFSGPYIPTICEQVFYICKLQHIHINVKSLPLGQRGIKTGVGAQERQAWSHDAADDHHRGDKSKLMGIPRRIAMQTI